MYERQDNSFKKSYVNLFSFTTYWILMGIGIFFFQKLGAKKADRKVGKQTS